MEPRIQYTKTSDGVSIAYYAVGDGPPIVHLPYLRASHVQLEWQLPGMREWYAGLSERWQLVRYDPRGTGLSDRSRMDYSVESLALELEAVVDRLGLERFALFAPAASGPTAITYAAQHPERVSHLILWSSWARAGTRAVTGQSVGLRALRDNDWETYTETFAHVRLGWTRGEEARRMASFIRECLTAESSRALDEMADEMDVSALLSQVAVPTLVLHGSGSTNLDVSDSKELAAGIPNASLTLVEGSGSMVASGDIERVLTAIDDFIGDAEPAEAEAAVPGGLVTILFTDIESSTSLRSRLGDDKAQELLHAHNTIVREALAAHDGSEIKHTGDGIMASFSSAAGAVGCAIVIQQHLAEHQGDAPLRLYIGLNAGEPILEDGDLFGTSVDLAKRICDQAQPEEILVSDVVRQLVAGKGFLFSDRGDTVLRGFEDPVKIWEVSWREQT